MISRKGKQIVFEGVQHMKNQKTFIYTTIQKEGYHLFPEACNPPYAIEEDSLYDVSHLMHKHMHYFTIRIWIQVKHQNRDIEFIQLRRWLEDYFGVGPYNFGPQSCEMIGEKLLDSLMELYPSNELKVEVAEDNINGAVVEYIPEIL